MNIRDLQYFKELEAALGNKADLSIWENALAEYEQHVFELVQEYEKHHEQHELMPEFASQQGQGAQDEQPHAFLHDAARRKGGRQRKPAGIKDEQLHVFLCERLGSPAEIARLWRQEAGITSRKMQQLFVYCNIVLFFGGIMLTVGYNMLDWMWMKRLWAGLTDAAFLIMIAYMLFWGLLGYEIGKAFGHSGRRHLRKTFTLSIIPNLILMQLTVFRLIPYEWFQPLLTFPFILICIFLTVLLYPVSWIGYQWGKKRSV